MGKVKSNDAKKFTLTDREFNTLKLMATCLAYNVAKDKIISSFLYMICNLRLGIAEGKDLQFEVDLDKEEGPHELLIKEVV